MKRTSFARRNALLPRGPRLAAITAALVAGLFLVLRLIAPGVFITLASPFWKLSMLAAADTHSVSAIFANPSALAAKLDAADAQNTALANENSTLSMQVHDLQSLLGSRTQARDGILAGVLARPPESPYDTLVLDQGSAAGVVVGAEVTGAGGVPVGKITSVTDSASRALLYSASGVVTPAWLGDSHIPLTLTGAGGGAFDASVSKDASTTPGEAVYIAGPGAILLGSVVRVDSDPSSPSATLRIQPVVNPYSITWVLVSRTAP